VPPGQHQAFPEAGDQPGRGVLLGEHGSDEGEPVRPGDRGSEVPQLGDQVGVDVVGLRQWFLDRHPGHRAGRQLVLAREAQVDGRTGGAGGAGHRVDGQTPVAAFGQQAAGGVQDALVQIRVPRPPAAPLRAHAGILT
jgi:hypothetical protein